jgi:hypothetical protein
VKRYYVHYVDWNKRLDEWVDIDRIDFDKIQPPKKVRNASACACVRVCECACVELCDGSRVCPLTSLHMHPPNRRKRSSCKVQLPSLRSEAVRSKSASASSPQRQSMLWYVAADA